MDSSSTILKIWKYRISKHRADYKTALTYLEQSLNDQNSEVLETVGQSVALAQSDYYENKSLLLDKDRRLQRREMDDLPYCRDDGGVWLGHLFKTQENMAASWRRCHSLMTK